MTGGVLVKLFEKGMKRCHVIGSVENGVIAGLDLEGRLFAVLNGEVLNRVNAEAILEVTGREKYLNPGGDGLWPAPEGTCLGYEYSTGKWRVPPGLSCAKFRLSGEYTNHGVIEAEVDLINASGLGIPTVFRRDITVETAKSALVVKVIESIEYIGSKTLPRNECLLAPWTLCQFDSEAGCEVVFPETHYSAVWDLYDSSSEKRYVKDGLIHAKTDGGMKYQIGIDKTVEWIEFRNPAKNLIVKRTASALPAGQEYIDIIDAPPDRIPSDKGTRFSVYSDPGFFMEIEACGGCPEKLVPGCKLTVDVETRYASIM
ncbi:MAG: hypothetical protein WC637_18925 [Victivallales bacterium]|jgi:hypothetical protein